MNYAVILKRVIEIIIIFILFITQNLSSQNDKFVLTKKSVKLSTGIDMKYVEMGSHNKETIVLVHGYTDTSRSFENVMQCIKKQHPNFRIICPDLRGHGGSSVPKNNEAFKIEDFSRDIFALLDAKNFLKFHLVGHSLGGMIAQVMAVNHPEKIKTLVLISTLSDASKNIAIHDFLMDELIFGTWKNQLVTEFGADWKNKSYHLTPKHLGKNVLEFLKHNWVVEVGTDVTYLKSIYQETINTPFVTWFETIQNISRFQNSSKIEQLKVPTLVIWGDKDSLMPNSPDQIKLKTDLKAAHQNHKTPVFFKTYSNTSSEGLKFGHNLHWAFPNEIAADIIDFISQNHKLKAHKSQTIEIGKPNAL